MMLSGRARREPGKRGILSKALLAPLFSAFFVILASAAPALASMDGVDKADTAWVMISAALVMLMIPGLAIFYAGMARRKNVLGTMMHSFFLLCLISIQWVIAGYTISFGGDVAGVTGNADFIMLRGVGIEAKGTIPHIVFMVFQGMFAAITIALITGAFAERIKFSAMVIFSLLWATFVYDPLCHWVWGGGWLGALGVLDFAGGIVVHISSGVSALVAALVVGRRRGYPRELMPPHNLTLTLTGMGLLWFGWFGFNAGSALAADGVAAMAFVATNTAGAAGALAWTFIEWAHRGRPTMLGAVSGAVAGLGSITPAAGFVTPMAAIVIGFVGGLFCYYAVTVIKAKFAYDDSLDVFGIHGVAGTWGTLATGLFATIGATGLLHGNATLLGKQAIGVLVTIVFSAAATYVILKIVDLAIGLRVAPEEEMQGLDLSQHGESGYTM